VPGFEWDEAKRAGNLAKHKLDFLRAREAFDGRPRLDIESSRGSESRFVTIAIVQGRFCAIVWTQGGEDLIRVISMRGARDEEKRQYRSLYG
jgi:uncharacterized DUF497 family protein